MVIKAMPHIIDDCKPTLWIVGDSTVCAFHDSYYMPRVGYGAMMRDMLDDRILVQNLAVSGTSSKSFLNHNNYQTLLSNMKDGDYLLIGFGHNDEKTGAVTFTSATGDYHTSGSFAESLYKNYIRPAKNVGCVCMLATPIVLRDETGRYEGNTIHNTAFGDYAQAIRTLGAELGITVIDLTSLTRQISLVVDGFLEPTAVPSEMYDLIPALQASVEEPDARTLYLHSWTGSREICCDDTHTNLFGAALNAWLVSREVIRQCAPLSQYIRSDRICPLLEAKHWREISINSDYHERVYKAPDKADLSWPIYRDENGCSWYGTVFGDINEGTCLSHQHFSLGKNPDGSMRIQAGLIENNGKIMAKCDGIAFYFTRIPAHIPFELTGTILLDSYNTAGSPAQFSGFGAMVRDDVYFNLETGELLGDYVAAGVTIQPSFDTGTNTFARKSGRLDFEGGSLESVPNAGSVIPVRLWSTPQGYAAQVGDHEPVLTGYDFALTTIDHTNTYAGFFAVRTVSIRVKNISLSLNGRKIKDYCPLG